MSQIGEEIKKLLEEHQSLKKSEARLAEIVPEIENVNREVQTLEQQMRKEFEDIENLEKLGMKALFYKVLGSQEEQLEKERQEYLQASLKYDQVRKNLELLEFEYNILKKKSGNLATIEQKLNDLSVRQEKELINMPGAAALEIKKIYLQIDQQERLKIDISEAIKAGLKALECIDAVIAGLQQAHNWGQWDVSGRNPMSNHLKYSAIDKAKDWAYESNRQLKDVYKQIPEDFQLHIDSFNRFIDVFFDNLITDWIIQQKIYNALNNTLNIRDKVVRMIKTLEGENPKVAQTISTLEQRKKEFILSNTV